MLEFCGKIFILLNKRETIVGKILWIINCTLILFYVYFILFILLSPFHFLKEFIFAIITILEFVIGYIFFLQKINLYKILDKIPLVYHIISFLILVFIYQYSIKYIWQNKKELIK